MEVKLRLANIDDVKILQELNQEVFVDNHQYDPDLIMEWALSEKGKHYFANLVQDNQAYCCLAEVNNKPVGYIAGREKKFGYRKSRYFEIENMGVIPEFRSKGIGALLINQTKEEAKKKGYQKIFVNSYFHNIKAIAFYKNHGMKEIDLSLEGTI